MPRISSDKRWEAESDARTMADANAIRKDPKRLVSAQRAAMGMVKEQTDKLNGLKTIARKRK